MVTDFIGVNAKTKYRDQSWALTKLLCGKEAGIRLGEGAGGASDTCGGRKDVYESDRLKKNPLHFLMRQFFMTIPLDFDEAAQIDGAGTFRVLREVLLPLCKPAITSVAIFSFLGHWNEFFAPLIYLNTPEKFTISLGLRYFQTIPTDPGEPKEHLLMAGTIMMAAPCVLLFFVAQRYFVQGIVMSGIKG